MFKDNTTLTAVLTANDLRLAAEKADGFRGIPLAVVEDNGSVAVIPMDDAMKSGKHVLVEVMTPLEGPGIPGDAKVILSWHDRIYPKPDQKETPLAVADAVFVSQSAVGKFLLPYYIHTRSGAAVQKLHDKLFKNKSVIAAIHIPPTDPFAVTKKAEYFAINSGLGMDDSFEFDPIS